MINSLNWSRERPQPAPSSPSSKPWLPEPNNSTRKTKQTLSFNSNVPSAPVSSDKSCHTPPFPPRSKGGTTSLPHWTPNSEGFTMNLQDEGVGDWTNPWTSTECPRRNENGTLKEAYALDVTRRDISLENALRKAGSARGEEAEEIKATSRLALGPCSMNSHLKKRPSFSTPSLRRIFDWARRGDAVRAQ